MTRSEAQQWVEDAWLKAVELCLNDAPQADIDHAMNNAEAAQAAFNRLEKRGDWDE